MSKKPELLILLAGGIQRKVEQKLTALNQESSLTEIMAAVNELRNQIKDNQLEAEIIIHYAKSINATINTRTLSFSESGQPNLNPDLLVTELDPEAADNEGKLLNPYTQLQKSLGVKLKLGYTVAGVTLKLI